MGQSSWTGLYEQLVFEININRSHLRCRDRLLSLDSSGNRCDNEESSSLERVSFDRSG
jgi:hypothetical protein